MILILVTVAGLSSTCQRTSKRLADTDSSWKPILWNASHISRSKVHKKHITFHNAFNLHQLCLIELQSWGLPGACNSSNHSINSRQQG